MNNSIKSLKWLSMLAVIIAVFALSAITAFAYEGSGTADDPYMISTFEYGEKLPGVPHETYYYKNDTDKTLYIYTKSGVDLYICEEDAKPCEDSDRLGWYNPSPAGDRWRWTTINDSMGNPPVIKYYKHSTRKVSAIPHTCTKNGVIEYYKCEVCDGLLFSDEGGYNQITEADTVDPAGHSLEEVSAVPHTCTENGIKAHFKCSVCNALFDEDGITEITEADTVDPAGHQMNHVSALAPTCTENGVKEYFKCEICEKLFSDEAGNIEIEEKDTVDPALGHKEVVVPGKAATEEATGLTEGKICERCKTVLVEQKEIPKLEKQDKKISSPPTGDNSMMMLYLLMGIAGTAGIVIISKKRKTA